ncbi:MAG: hypothetical protein L0211_06345 [Planctomycetaceae bacterium]|nr:hypothetical protein [Planctomycetaceae bacterium]
MTTKRRILLCRIGFVLFCLVPTLAVGLWAAAHSEGNANQDFATAEFQRELFNRLGLVIEFDQASGTPEAFRLEGLRFRDPETDEIVAQAVAIEAIHADGVWRVETFQPMVNLTHAQRLLPRLADRLLCGPSGSDPAVVVTARQLLVAASGRQQSFGQGTVQLHESRSQTDLVIELFAAGQDPPAEPLKLTVTRNRAVKPPTTNWQFTTGSQQLSLALLVDIIPHVIRLGPHGHFAGAIDAGEYDGQPWFTAKGTLAGVDFDSLVTEHFPHQLSGHGTIQIERANIQDGRLVEFRGGIDIISGSASKSLLAAAGEHLGLIVSGELPASDFATIPFERLAMDLALDGRNLQIRGKAGQGDEQTVLTGATGTLLASSRGHSVPAVNLLRALLPDNQFQVPATRQTDVLVGLLPVPELAPTRTAALPTHVPTRLRSSGPAETAPVLRQPGLR